MTTTSSITGERRDGAGDEQPDERRPATSAQTGAEGVAAPSATLTSAHPSQSGEGRAETTTTQREPFEPVSDESRAVARAVLATLSPGAAACVLVALAGLASAIIGAASMLRHATGEGERRAASAMLDAASVDAFDALMVDGEDCGTAAYAVCASWWLSTPCDVVASFWRDDIARANVEAQARGVLAEVAAMRRGVSQSEALTSAPVVVRLPMPAGVERIQSRGVTYESSEREALCAILRDVAREVAESGALSGNNARLAVELANVHACGTLSDLMFMASTLSERAVKRFAKRDAPMRAVDVLRGFEAIEVAARLVAFVRASTLHTPNADLEDIDVASAAMSSAL